jgi:hypothetical protein
MSGTKRPSGKQPVALNGQQIIHAASYYPPMIVGFCYDSAEILAGVYHELRTADGIRSAELPGDEEPREIEHGWCVKQDGTIIDAVFAEELMNDPDPAAVRVTYSEIPLSSPSRSGRPGALRDAIKKIASEERPPLISKNRKRKFAEKQRDMFREWLKSNNFID